MQIRANQSGPFGVDSKPQSELKKAQHGIVDILEETDLS